MKNEIYVILAGSCGGNLISTFSGTLEDLAKIQNADPHQSIFTVDQERLDRELAESKEDEREPDFTECGIYYTTHCDELPQLAPNLEYAVSECASYDAHPFWMGTLEATRDMVANKSHYVGHKVSKLKEELSHYD
jgi:hypothetical protein